MPSKEWRRKEYWRRKLRGQCVVEGCRNKAGVTVRCDKHRAQYNLLWKRINDGTTNSTTTTRASIPSIH